MNRKPKPGDCVELTVTALDAKGRGVAPLDGLQVAVRSAVPGDRIVARLRKVRRRRGEAEAGILERIESETERVDAKCTHFGTCGGCVWQDIPYPHQIALKESLVADALAGAGFDIALGETLEAPSPFHYRNKMEFSFGETESGEVAIGLHLAGRFNRIFDLEACHLESELSNAIVHHVRDFARRRGLKPYDLKRHEGLLRFLTIREGKHTDEILVAVTTSGEPFVEGPDLARELQERFPAVTCVIHSVNRRVAQVATGEEEIALSTRSSMTEKLGGILFDVSLPSFFQPNTLQAERMFARVVELAEPASGDQVLDLYCGTGAISFQLAPHVARVLGVELSDTAVKDAARNSASNGIENCRFVSGPAEEILAQLRAEGEAFDLAVTDPPRAGMHAKALAALGELAPGRIVYVSCNPQALARDAALFRGQGYALTQAQLVDMLPHTPHCEVLARFDRA